MNDKLLEEDKRLQATEAPLSHTEGSPIESTDFRLYMKIVESTRDAIVLVDSRGKIKLWNLAAEKLFGWTKDEAMNQDVHDLIALDNTHQRASEGIDGFHITGEGSLINHTSILHGKHKEGHVFPLELALSTMQIDTRKFAIATIRDITTRVQCETEIRKSEEKYRTLFEDSRDALMTLGPPDWLFSKCNKSTLKMFGTDTEEEFVSHSPWDYSPKYQPDAKLSTEKAKEMIEIAIQKKSHLFEWTHMRLNGEEFPTTVLLTRTEIDGEMTVMACVRDISKQVKQEKELRRWAEIFKYAEWGIALIDEESNEPSLMNPTFAKMHGYAQEELVGKPLSSLCTQECLVQSCEFINQAPTEGHLVFESVHRRKNGTTFPVRIDISSPKNANGDPLNRIIQVVDITKEADQKAQKEELEKQYFQAQKMESIGTLAGGVAHDFNNLLTVILASADFIQEEIPAGSLIYEDLSQIQTAANRAAELTKGLLAFSRKQTLKQTRSNLNDIITEFLPTLRHIIGEDVLLDHNCCLSLPEVMVDQAQITSIIANLVTNARHAMPDGGHLTVTSELATFDKTNVPQCENANIGDYVILKVSDTGTGIPADKLPRIFEPFFTTKDVGVGTGLGLSMVHGSVIQQGGFVDVHTREGKGTEFRICFPALSRKVKHLPVEAKMETNHGHETILVVEDEEPVRKAVIRILRKYGYTVLEADNAGTAYLVLNKQHEMQKDIDMVLTDVRMPMVSGTELGKDIEARFPKISLLYMSGYNQEGEEKLSGKHFIAKPFDSIDIARKIRQILDNKLSDKSI